MVSSEGACAAYYAYGRHLEAEGATAVGSPLSVTPTTPIAT